MAEPGSAFIYGPSALQVFYEVLKKKLGDNRPRVYLSSGAILRKAQGSVRNVISRSRGQSLARIGLGNSRAQAVGENRKTRPRRRVADYLARVALEEFWRGSDANRAFSLGWWNNRLRPAGREFDFEKMLDREMVAQDWSAPVFAATRPTTWSPASVLAINAFTSFHRWKSSSFGTGLGVVFGRSVPAASAAVIGIGVGAGGIAAGAECSRLVRLSSPRPLSASRS